MIYDGMRSHQEMSMQANQDKLCTGIVAYRSIVSRSFPFECDSPNIYFILLPIFMPAGSFCRVERLGVDVFSFVEHPLIFFRKTRISELGSMLGNF